jgi:hypothetical protein
MDGFNDSEYSNYDLTILSGGKKIRKNVENGKAADSDLADVL